VNRTRISASEFSNCSTNKPAASKEIASWKDVLMLKFEEVMEKDYKAKNDAAQPPKPTFCTFFCIFN
jgi:hypothetical protein